MRNKLFILPFLVAGCMSTSPEGDTSSKNIDPIIPAFSGVANCTVPAGKLDVCVWAESSDKVVYGRIQSIDVVEDAFVEDDGSLVDSCSKSANYAIAITLTDMKGTGETGTSNLKFYVGVETLDQWSVVPVRDTDGSVKWLGPQQLRVGQYLGAAIHQVGSNGDWSLAGETLFIENSAGDVVFQQGSAPNCYTIAPEISNTSVNDLFATLRSCAADTQKVMEREAVATGYFSRSPKRTYAGECFWGEMGPK